MEKEDPNQLVVNASCLGTASEVLLTSTHESKRNSSHNKKDRLGLDGGPSPFHRQETVNPTQGNLSPTSPMKYYEVYIEQLLPAEEQKHHQMLWKFLIALPESTQRPSDESEAISVAKKAGGTELRTDFNVSSSRAEFVTPDAAKVDFAKSITIDECRVWVLQKPALS